ncbi:PREDICTED: chymotrypsin-2-like [Ceratosolen solmsi marchali]|uniref:Chymotrypsin-2-like n=1 Tax=Ceratosolen solmsi marchali TaxID=326594 RepID=A0AAJ6YCB6_9HYME|nr:PREDICTED: chymotrypsin-2-like [Ceratosolen solmsi marchali]
MEFKVFLLLAVCTIICTQCNFTTANPLLGPNVRHAELGEFPSVVSIAKTSSSNRANINDHICTATAITKSHILGSAHCLYERLYNNTVILYGSTALIFTRAYSIRWWIKFQDWSVYNTRRPEFLENDIAIIKLTEPIQANFQPSELSFVPYHELVNEQVTLAGWGISRRRVVTPNMQTSITKIISNPECEDRITQLNRRRVIIHHGLFCTYGVPYTLIQNGDIGGPVFHNNKIVGINKHTLPFTSSEFHPNKVCVHSSINYYRPFIMEVISDNFYWD